MYCHRLSSSPFPCRFIYFKIHFLSLIISQKGVGITVFKLICKLKTFIELYVYVCIAHSQTTMWWRPAGSRAGGGGGRRQSLAGWLEGLGEGKMEDICNSVNNKKSIIKKTFICFIYVRKLSLISLGYFSFAQLIIGQI